MTIKQWIEFILDNKCPILNLEFKSGVSNRDNLPSIDKIVPHKGYVKGNVQIISFKANAYKSNMSLKQIKKLYNYMKKNISKTDLHKEK